MSNHLYIEPTRFVNLSSNEQRMGVRIHDDYGMYYDDSWSDIPFDAMAILRKVYEEADEASVAVFEQLRQVQKGLYIAGDYYPWDKIKNVFEEVDNGKEGHTKG